MTAVTVLFRDEWVLALDKPSGMPVHRGWAGAEGALVDLVRELSGDGVARPAHRLDRGTSGVVLFALDRETARALGALFESGAVEKRYLALVRGEAPDHAVVDHPIPRVEGGERASAVTEIFRIAAVKAEPRALSLVEARPRSGRLHQVRRHLKHIDHPVIGDANYGKGALNREIAARYGLHRLALHAVSIAFVHPRTGERLEISAPLPGDLEGPLTAMGFGAALYEAVRS
jgi:tRNA pseudouridine65 synthase